MRVNHEHCGEEGADEKSEYIDDCDEKVSVNKRDFVVKKVLGSMLRMVYIK